MELSEMVEIFNCRHTATVALLKRDLTPRECLLHWKQVVFKLNGVEKPLAILLSNFLILCQKRLLMNEAFVGMFSFFKVFLSFSGLLYETLTLELYANVKKEKWQSNLV